MFECKYLVFPTIGLSFAEKRSMKEKLEDAYEEFASIAEGEWTPEVKAVLLQDLYRRLGVPSVAFDNMLYERLGMSAEEIMDIFSAGDVLPGPAIPGTEK